MCLKKLFQFLGKYFREKFHWKIIFVKESHGFYKENNLEMKKTNVFFFFFFNAGFLRNIFKVDIMCFCRKDL